MISAVPVSSMQAVKYVLNDDFTVVAIVYIVITSFSGQGSSRVSTEKRGE